MHICPYGSHDWVCNEVERCFRCATVEHARRHPGGDVEDCMSCKLATIQVSPTVRGEAKNTIAPKGNDGRNSWEKGVATDHRGLPFRDATGAPIPIKRFAANRAKFEESIRANHNGTLATR